MAQRADRFARLIQEELSGLLAEVKDPRVADAGLITITHVRVSDDLGVAHILLTLHDSTPEDRARLMAGLKAARPFLQRQLGRGLNAKKTPELRFRTDETDERAGKIAAIGAVIAAERKPTE